MIRSLHGDASRLAALGGDARWNAGRTGEEPGERANVTGRQGPCNGLTVVRSPTRGVSADRLGVLADKRIRIHSPSVASASTEPKTDAMPEKESAIAETDKQEMQAQNKLNFAEQYRDRPSRYKEKLQEVIKQFPDTKAAKQAKEILAKLK